MTGAIKQEFQSDVENVAGRDVINIHQESARFLTREERKILNDKVRELTGYGIEGWKTWKFLHKTIGIDNIDEMNLEHRDAANAILDLLIDLRIAEIKLALLEQNSQIIETAPIEDTKAAKTILELMAESEQLKKDKYGLIAKCEQLEERNTQLKYYLKSIEMTQEQDTLPMQKYNKYSIVYFSLFLISLLLNIAFIIYQGKLIAKPTAVVNNPHLCEYNNQTYSIGSIINMQKDTMQCKMLDGKNYPGWDVFKPEVKKKGR